MENYSYLGQAIKYPVELRNGSLVMVSGPDIINSSYIKILTTPKGSRFFLPEYGSRFPQILFDVNDEVTLRLLRADMLMALNQWETRAKVVDINMSTGDDMVLCDIKYRILPKNEILSFVFPFYTSLNW